MTTRIPPASLDPRVLDDCVEALGDSASAARNAQNALREAYMTAEKFESAVDAIYRDPTLTEPQKDAAQAELADKAGGQMGAILNRGAQTVYDAIEAADNAAEATFVSV